MLQRMRELAVQASNDTNNTADRGFLDGEFQQLKTEINRVAQNTQWNGANILDGTGGIAADGKFAFQVGANANQTISLQLANMGTGIDTTSGFTGFITAAAPMQSSTATTTATFNLLTGMFSGATTSTLVGAYVGVTLQASVDGKNVQYTFTQDDVNTALTAEASATGTGGKLSLAKTLASALKTKLSAALGSSYTVNANAADSVADGTLTVVNGTAGAGNYSLANKTSAVGNAFISVQKGSLSGIGASSINVTTGSLAYTALGAIDSALQTVNEKRSAMGATISRLQFASDNLANVSAKAAESKSRIEDTDYSIATTELAKRNIIQQAAQAMLAQANQAPQLVLQLLK